MRITILFLLACGTAASAQDSARVASPDSRSAFVVVASGGTSLNGPAVRLLAIGERHVGDRMSIGLASRFVAARGAYPITEGLVTDEETYAEFGLSLRPAYRLTDYVQVAASAGYGLVLLTDRDAYYLPVNDIGFTLPLELEGAVHIWDRIGITAAMSRSIALSSMRTESESVRFPEGYALDHWTATVGVRLGRW